MPGSLPASGMLPRRGVAPLGHERNKAPHPRYPDRNADGAYRGGDAPNGVKAAESKALDELENRYGVKIEREQVLTKIRGANHSRK